MTDIKDYSQNKGKCNDKSIPQNSCISPHNNACETP